MEHDVTGLSVCCATAAPLARTAALLELFAGVADEIICAVDERVPSDELRHLDGRADVVVRCQFDPVASIERNLAWLHGLCGRRWILRVDSDEVPSQALLASMKELLGDPDVAHYVLRRRWLYPDASQTIEEHPWHDDWQIRLVRNDATLLRFSGELHSSAELVGPYRFVEEPLYHLDLLVSSAEARREKVARYEARRPGHRTPQGRSVNDLYEPERVDPRARGSVPPEDRAAIRAVLDARPLEPTPTDRRRAWSFADGPPRLASFEEIDRTWALRTVDESAYRAHLELVEPLDVMDVGEVREVVVRVYNDGTEHWPDGARFPEFRLAHRWFASDGDRVFLDGARTPFVAPVAPGSVVLQRMTVVAPSTPGDHVLELNVVHERFRWFPGGLRLTVTIRLRGEPSVPSAFADEELALGLRELTMVAQDRLRSFVAQIDTVLREEVPGDIVECGVFRGGASILAARRLKVAGATDRRVWCFDSFEGLPPPGPLDGERAAAWARDVESPAYFDNCSATLDGVVAAAKVHGVLEQMTFVKGWFEDTLPGAAARTGPIAILRIDGDWHDSVRACLDGLFDAVSPGGYVIVDDYFDWQGASLALHEFLGARGLSDPIHTEGSTVYLRRA